MSLSSPVVPVTIDGSFSVMPRAARLPLPGTIRIAIHKANHPLRREATTWSASWAQRLGDSLGLSSSGR